MWTLYYPRREVMALDRYGVNNNKIPNALICQEFGRGRKIRAFVNLSKGRFHKKNHVKSLVFSQTSLDLRDFFCETFPKF